jgi:hypothetical protein
VTGTTVTTATPTLPVLEPVSGPAGSCRLIRIERGRIHLISESWIRPGTRSVVRLDRIAFTGEIAYCNKKEGEYHTCLLTRNKRSGPRFPVDEPGTLTILGNGGTEGDLDCRLTELSRLGLRLQAAKELKVGCVICVQTRYMTVVGEVRHQRQTREGTFEMGVEITEVLSDETARRTDKSLRQRLAEFILGYRISSI